MAEAATLAATTRERLGSRYAKRARAAGKMPAVVYGHGEAPMAVELDAKETLKHIHKGEKLFELSMDSGSQTVLLKDLQFDYLGTNIIHCDFARVDLNERVHTRVHLEFVGDAVGLKGGGNTMVHPVNEIEIECRVADLPDFLEVDMTDLEAGHHLSAKDVKLAEGMTLVSDPELVIAAITAADTDTADEAASVEGGDEPEVMNEKKEG